MCDKFIKINCIFFIVQAQRELHELINAREKEKARGEESMRFFATVFRLPVLKPLMLINAFNMLQILSGSYVVIFYAVDIVTKTGGSLEPHVSFSISIDNVSLAVSTASLFILMLEESLPAAQ